MKIKIVIIIIFSLVIINTIAAGYWILEIGWKTELLVQRKESLYKLDRSLYSSTSLEVSISKLKEEISYQKSLTRKDKEYNTLEMTEKVLFFLEKNRIKVISYRLEGEKNREELVLTAEGEIGNILKLIYELSFSKEGYRINFISVDAGVPEKPATIVIRIIYA